MSTSESGLQNCLNNISGYCRMWKLNFNTQKTKLMIFSQGRKMLTSQIYFDGIKVKLVDQYKYLGFEIFFNGNLKHSASALCDKSLKALFSLRSKLNNFENIPVRIQVK